MLQQLHGLGAAAQVAAQRYKNGAMPVLYKHMIAVGYQIAQFRWGPAAAALEDKLLPSSCPA